MGAQPGWVSTAAQPSGETALPQPVVGHHVEAGVLGERAEKPHEEEDPAERIAGLAPRHYQAHRTVGGRKPYRQRAAGGVHALVRQPGQRHGSGRQGEQRAGEQPGG